jgi:hypothetical protein
MDSSTDHVGRHARWSALSHRPSGDKITVTFHGTPAVWRKPVPIIKRAC